jgi:hypothetical protein
MPDLLQPQSIPKQPPYDTFGYSIERLINGRKKRDHAAGGSKVRSNNLANTIYVIHERAVVVTMSCLLIGADSTQLSVTLEANSRALWILHK